MAGPSDEEASPAGEAAPEELGTVETNPPPIRSVVPFRLPVP
jgi:hypothetical protein